MHSWIHAPLQQVRLDSRPPALDHKDAHMSTGQCSEHGPGRSWVCMVLQVPGLEDMQPSNTLAEDPSPDATTRPS